MSTMVKIVSRHESKDKTDTLTTKSIKDHAALRQAVRSKAMAEGLDDRQVSRILATFNDRDYREADETIRKGESVGDLLFKIASRDEVFTVDCFDIANGKRYFQ